MIKYIDYYDNHGDLTPLVNQGVLLLNVVLTAKTNKSNSHKNIGWEYFTSRLLSCLDQKYKFVVLSCGKYAQSITKTNIIKNIVVNVGHPSPLNKYKPFVGSNCFHTVNSSLKLLNMSPIVWYNVFLYNIN